MARYRAMTAVVLVCSLAAWLFVLGIDSPAVNQAAWIVSIAIAASFVIAFLEGARRGSSRHPDQRGPQR